MNLCDYTIRRADVYKYTYVRLHEIPEYTNWDCFTPDRVRADAAIALAAARVLNGICGIPKRTAFLIGFEMSFVLFYQLEVSDLRFIEEDLLLDAAAKGARKCYLDAEAFFEAFFQCREELYQVSEEFRIESARICAFPYEMAPNYEWPSGDTYKVKFSPNRDTMHEGRENFLLSYNIDPETLAFRLPEVWRGYAEKHQRQRIELLRGNP